MKPEATYVHYRVEYPSQNVCIGTCSFTESQTRFDGLK
jgi:hypothetical protein